MIKRIIRWIIKALLRAWDYFKRRWSANHPVDAKFGKPTMIRERKRLCEPDYALRIDQYEYG